MKKVAIQGARCSFHDIATKALFESCDYEIVECISFNDLFSLLESNSDMYGVVAIENTLVGGLLQNYNLLLRSPAKIIAEYKLRIEHSLLALPGEKIEDIDEVHSHPMALLQCEKFLHQYPHIKAVEADDTAASARRVAESKIKGRAAIASFNAAKIYGLDCLERGIETNKHNYTRFFKLSQNYNEIKFNNPLCNKASIAFCLPHEVGSLAKVLNLWLIFGVNLTKIQSMPIVGQEWKYRFFVDLVFDDYDKFKLSLEAVKVITEEIIILGEYIKH